MMPEGTERIKDRVFYGKEMQRRLKKYAAILFFVWTLSVAASLLWDIKSVKQNIIESADIMTSIAFEKDIQYRRWNAEHGGVYVPVTEETPPNPYLEGIVKERDIITPSGKKLTLLNPAYMTRQVHELAEREYLVRGHITSLDPIRPENFADLWETEALQSFENGNHEVRSLGKIKGVEYMRLMRPMVTEEKCLKCHAAQGYKVGDIRGGISTSVPMERFRTIEKDQISKLFVTHTLLWLAGIGILVIGLLRINRSEKHRLILENETVKAAQEWRKTFDAISDPVSVHDTSFRIIKVNKAFADFFGKSPDELIGKYCYEIVHKLSEPLAVCPHKDVLRSGKTVISEIYDQNSNLYFIVTVSPVFEDGKIISSVHYIRDITESKKAAEDLKARSEELEKVNKAFVGRELRMAEMKKEIEELKKNVKS